MKSTKVQKLLQTLQLATENIEIIELVKEGSIPGSTMCCATTAKVNDAREKVDYKNMGRL